MSFPLFPSVVIAFVGGLALGLVHLTLLAASIRLFLRGDRPGLGAALSVARLLTMGAGMWVAVQFGAPALIGALAGFTTTRVLGTRYPKVALWT